MKTAQQTNPNPSPFVRNKTDPTINNERVKTINKSCNKTRTLRLLQCSRTTYQYGHKGQWWLVLSSPISATATNKYLTVSVAEKCSQFSRAWTLPQC